jgi:hypothetical protein
MKREIIDKSLLPQFYKFLIEKELILEYDDRKKSIRAFDPLNKDVQLIKLRLPIDHSFKNESNEIVFTSPIQEYVILVVQSGMACLGLFKDFKNSNHKVFRAYMVRKQQGKSQIKHLKTKGKSRAGSRVRLAETLEFFEEINTRLQKYFKENKIDFIAYQVSELLLPYFYGSKIVTPFDKKDSRLFKIPIHITQPTYEAMMALNQELLKAEIGFIAKGEEIWASFNAENQKDFSKRMEDDNW